MRKRRRRRRFKKKYPNYGKREARAAVAKAVKQERLKYTGSCELCLKKNVKTEFHHWQGYRKENWLKVKEVCKKCHIKEDKKSREIRKYLAKKYEQEKEEKG